MGDSVSRKTAHALVTQLRSLPVIQSGNTSSPYNCTLDCDVVNAENVRYALSSKCSPLPFSEEDPELEVTHVPPLWSSFAQCRGEKPIFIPAWDDTFAFVDTTNTTLVVIFCFTPEVLREKLRLVWSAHFRWLPDVVVFNTGLWSRLGPNFADVTNKHLQSFNYSGRVRIPEFVLLDFVAELMGIVHGVDSHLLSLQTYRPLVAYREQNWIDCKAPSNTEFAIYAAVKEAWMKHPPSLVKYVPYFALSALKCCSYEDYCHPTPKCLLFLNTFLANTLFPTLPG
jgi:hypothetical protein